MPVSGQHIDRSRSGRRCLTSVRRPTEQTPQDAPSGDPKHRSQGFAHTELSFNSLGLGTRAFPLPNGSGKSYNVGMVYGADAFVGLQL